MRVKRSRRKVAVRGPPQPEAVRAGESESGAANTGETTPLLIAYNRRAELNATARQLTGGSHHETNGDCRRACRVVCNPGAGAKSAGRHADPGPRGGGEAHWADTCGEVTRGGGLNDCARAGC